LCDWSPSPLTLPAMGILSFPSPLRTCNELHLLSTVRYLCLWAPVSPESTIPKRPMTTTLDQLHLVCQYKNRHNRFGHILLHPLQRTSRRIPCLPMQTSVSATRHLRLLSTYSELRRGRRPVIIGSGISGASFARTLLGIDQQRDGEGKPLTVVMLEAHETCSGASGR